MEEVSEDELYPLVFASQFAGNGVLEHVHFAGNEAFGVEWVDILAVAYLL